MRLPAGERVSAALISISQTTRDASVYVSIDVAVYRARRAAIGDFNRRISSEGGRIPHQKAEISLLCHGLQVSPDSARRAAALLLGLSDQRDKHAPGGQA